MYFSFVSSFGHFYSFAALPVVVGFFFAHLVNGQYINIYNMGLYLYCSFVVSFIFLVFLFSPVLLVPSLSILLMGSMAEVQVYLEAILKV